MASRKKVDPAVLRTVDIFTGKTKIEEAEDMAREELPFPDDDLPFPDTDRDIVAEAEECAVRWLGLDAFHMGDDIKIALHPAGHAVLTLVAATRVGVPYATSTLKLSRAQVQKLKKLARELP